jgi:organic radical activating enzyme
MRIFKVNNIFYSLQGEGRNTGRAAVFVRFAGCNLRCPFCDTDFEEFTMMTDEMILAEIQRLTSSIQTPLTSEGVGDKLLVVLTGGEPTLQVDEAFVDLLHQHGYEVAMESNGTRPAPRNLDWLTVSPKDGGMWNGEGRMPDEIKIVFDEHTAEKLSSFHFPPTSFHLPPSTFHHPLLYLQPCDTGDAARNIEIVAQCVEYIKAHPQWRLSLQTHKLIDIE